MSGTQTRFDPAFSKYKIENTSKTSKKKKTLNSHINAVNWVVLHRFLAEYLSNICNGSIKALR